MSRRYYIDYLKAFGCIAVVALHVITNRLDHTTTSEINYFFLSGLLVLTRWSVPAFVMVSGCNLLGRDNQWSIVKKHSLKMLIFTVLWGIIHLLADPFINFLTGKPFDSSALALSNLFQGPAYHLWFCFMIIGLYLLIPVLNPIVKDKKNCEYFILICLFSTIALPFLEKMGHTVPVLETLALHMRFPQLGIYICYFVLGYYVERHLDLSASRRTILYILSAACLVLMIAYGFSNAITYQKHTAITSPEDLTVFILSLGVFTFFKYHVNKGKFYNFFALLAKHSFGIYVMHSYLIIRLSWKGIHSVMFHPLIAIPFVTVLVVAICLAASCLLRKIPAIGKWIV